MSALPLPTVQPTFDEAMAMLRGSVTVVVQPLSDAQIKQLLERDAAAEACNEVDE